MNTLPDSRCPRFTLIGGFLGAGKTSSVNRLAQWVHARGSRAGIITNDQAEDLVDTVVSQATAGMEAVRQITGGCFCCKSDDLVRALADLQKSVRPDYFIAEPTGSCTDLMATTILPLQKIYNQELAIAPMSVLIDADRLYSTYYPRKGDPMRGFSADVNYILMKQMEEAEVIVLNKIDLLSTVKRSRLLGQLRPFTNKRLLETSLKSGEGLEEWFTLISTAVSSPHKLMEVDYERYARGEAALGWYNASLTVHATATPIDGNKLLGDIAAEVQQEFEKHFLEIAHFKMSLRNPSLLHPELSVLNLVRNGSKPSFSKRLRSKIVSAELLINVRAEGDPKTMEAIIYEQIMRPRKAIKFVWQSKAAFRPAKPTPLYREILI